MSATMHHHHYSIGAELLLLCCVLACLVGADGGFEKMMIPGLMKRGIKKIFKWGMERNYCKDEGMIVQLKVLLKGGKSSLRNSL